MPLTLFPDSLLALAGGLAFGVYWGTLYTIVGAVCGCSLSFYISRTFGRFIVEKLVKGKAQWFDDGIEKKGFVIILFLRLIPLIPFDIISYSAGLSKIKYNDFLTATIIGIIPGVLVYTNLGDKLVDIRSIPFLCACLAFLILCGISLLLKRKITLDKLQKKFINKESDLI